MVAADLCKSSKKQDIDKSPVCGGFLFARMVTSTYNRKMQGSLKPVTALYFTFIHKKKPQLAAAFGINNFTNKL
jgi:hypothetical protein